MIRSEDCVHVLYLTRDLFFSTKISSTARQHGISVQVIGSIEQLQTRLDSDPVGAVLVDLEHPDAEPTGLLNRIRSTARPPPAIAYGPHVKESLLAAAQNAGFDRVLSRGQFDQQILQLLQDLLSQEKSPGPTT